MAIVNLQSDFAKTGQAIESYTAYNLVALQATIETNADDTSTSTYDFGLIPANAIIHYSSSISNDDLATTGSPTLDWGLFEVDGNLTDAGLSDDDDCIKANVSASTSQIQRSLFADLAQSVLPLYRLINGATESTRVTGNLRLKATLKDANIDTAGTVQANILYYTK